MSYLETLWRLAPAVLAGSLFAGLAFSYVAVTGKRLVKSFATTVSTYSAYYVIGVLLAAWYLSAHQSHDAGSTSTRLTVLRFVPIVTLLTGFVSVLRSEGTVDALILLAGAGLSQICVGVGVVLIEFSLR